MSKLTEWFPVNIQPVRSDFYELDSADVLHFDTRSKTWGIWFPQQPGVRHVFTLGSHVRLRGLTNKDAEQK